MTLLADYWALRVLPVALRTRALEDGKGLVTKISGSVSGEPTGDLRTYNSYRQFKQFLRDEGGASVTWAAPPPQAARPPQPLTDEARGAIWQG
jgi:hypothetical protein